MRVDKPARLPYHASLSTRFRDPGAKIGFQAKNAIGLYEFSTVCAKSIQLQRNWCLRFSRKRLKINRLHLAVRMVSVLQY